MKTIGITGNIGSGKDAVVKLSKVRMWRRTDQPTVAPAASATSTRRSSETLYTVFQEGLGPWHRYVVDAPLMYWLRGHNNIDEQLAAAVKTEETKK